MNDLINKDPSMKSYKSHKIVRAAKISVAESQADGTWRYATGDGVPHHLDHATSKRFHPTEEDPGYVVVYPDGYVSWSPSKAFEEGYVVINDFEFVNQGVEGAQMVAASLKGSGAAQFSYETGGLTITCFETKAGYQKHDVTEDEPSGAGLSAAELAILDQYKDDLQDMGMVELQQELTSVTNTIDEEESWQEALTARLKQMKLSPTPPD